MPIPPSSEKALYAPMALWLKKYLESRYRGSRIEVFDTSQKSLSYFISANNFGSYLPPEWNSWDIHVDITGFILNGNTAELAFIEAKVGELSLSELSQLLGYSRVAHPLHSFLLSPKGCSGSLTSLLVSYNRKDVLIYQERKGFTNRTISIATWDTSTNSINHASLIG
ncbi:MAG TPA: hypothetical protein VH186_32460 [Chloroflexia bacterium]|nr:hypothetical protein [Chloroflexia bacterium]